MRKEEHILSPTGLWADNQRWARGICNKIANQYTSLSGSIKSPQNISFLMSLGGNCWVSNDGLAVHYRCCIAVTDRVVSRLARGTTSILPIGRPKRKTDLSPHLQHRLRFRDILSPLPFLHLLKPSCCFKVPPISTMYPHRAIVFGVDHGTNSDYFPIRH